MANDSEIIDLFLCRDERAIAETEKRYGRKLASLSLAIHGSLSDAEECVNDTCYRAWETIPPNEPREHFFAYLAKIAREISIDRLRANTRKKRAGETVALTAELSEIIPDASLPDGEVEGRELLGFIRDFLNTLPDLERNLFVRRYFFADPIEALSRRFAITKSNAKVSLFRLRERLRKYLSERGYTV